MLTCECYVKLNDGECPKIEYNCFDCPSIEVSYDSKNESSSRSSCTGSSCDVILDSHHNKEIQLDSLEDLAHVIDQEVVHNKGRFAPEVRRDDDRSYSNFIDSDGNVVSDPDESESEDASEDDSHPIGGSFGDIRSNASDDESVDSNLVDVPSVHAPTKSDIPDRDSDDDGPKPWELANREGANFGTDELPDFEVGTIEKPDIPEPVIPEVPDSSETLNSGDGDIWGAYLAKWKKPAQTTIVKPQAPPVRETGYLVKGNYARPVVFDAGHYLAKSRELAPVAGVAGNAAAQGWWDVEEEVEDPWNAPEEPWWEQLSQGYENDNGYKVKKTNFVPNSTYVAKSS